MRTLILIWGGILVLSLRLSAEPATRVHYVGGTLSQLPARTSGTLRIGDDEVFTFQAAGATIRVPYRDVNLLEYGQRVSRRYLEAIFISPVFLLSKRRAYFLSVGYTDKSGKQQAMVFQVSSKEIRPVLVSLEARSGRKVEYQDDEARKSGKG
ncbi:MAG TPA: hypothetical protein VGL72_14870 [Bryobacteraceae bacterium]|jgi:hypothetical protein